MAQRTIDEEIAELESEEDNYTTLLTNQAGFKSIQGAGNEGAKTDFTDPIKIKELRQDVRDRLAQARLRKSKGYSV